MEKNLLDALQTNPAGQLSAGFAENILLKIQKRERMAARRNMFLLIFGVLVFLGLSTGALIFVLGIDYLTQLKSVGIWGTALGVLVLIVQYLDQLLVRGKLMKSV